MQANQDDPTVIALTERAQAISAIEILLRLVRKAHDCFEGDDVETILVILTVAAASAGKHLRDPELLEALKTHSLPDHLHQPTSGRSIADSTGLPRETVRRRLKALVEAGRLVKDARGYRTLSGMLTRNRNLEFSRFIIGELKAAPHKLDRF
ncbi:hypothetical protein KOAAANKH_01641 [Brevundimonas sp. NIBR10]|uniref:hypothetical protein n=1 Tax=Brevundimonas sp. NIBR10 TaxID=3015997 RepID=UPI0022F19D43|nr:hypothetical protein [Brevundimonas sp. NIBR10]WGM46768.1 hypothetical protein KOAAANKH_01641 [Brevundimonas sp. NIBR10]